MTSTSYAAAPRQSLIAKLLWNGPGWFLLAFPDTFAGDLGDTYQGILRLLVSTAIVSIIGVLATLHTPLGWGVSALIALCLYTFFGLLYNLHNYRWGM